MLGLKRGTVKLVSHHDEWAKLYEKEKNLLLQTLGNRVLGIEHIGSTAIPGTPAKPVIGINLAIASLDDEYVKEFITPLEKIGYIYDEYFENRRFFVKGPEEKRLFHLNLVKAGDQTGWKDPILFRDYLIRHQKEREEYIALKQKLAKQFANDRPSYTAAKQEFTVNIIAKARAESYNG